MLCSFSPDLIMMITEKYDNLMNLVGIGSESCAALLKDYVQGHHQFLNVDMKRPAGTASQMCGYYMPAFHLIFKYHSSFYMELVA
jgi:hypothetical protein